MPASSNIGGLSEFSPEGDNKGILESLLEENELAVLRRIWTKRQVGGLSNIALLHQLVAFSNHELQLNDPLLTLTAKEQKQMLTKEVEKELPNWLKLTAQPYQFGQYTNTLMYLQELREQGRIPDEYTEGVDFLTALCLLAERDIDKIDDYDEMTTLKTSRELAAAALPFLLSNKLAGCPNQEEITALKEQLLRFIDLPSANFNDPQRIQTLQVQLRNKIETI